VNSIATSGDQVFVGGNFHGTIIPGVNARYVAFYDGQNWQQLDMSTNGIINAVSFMLGNGVPIVSVAPSLSNIGTSFVTLLLYQALSNGCPILYYEIQKKLSTDPYFVYDGLTSYSNLTYNMTNLLPFTSYDVKYRAYNYKGASPWSPTVTFTTLLQEMAECVAWGDPHYFTFNGQPFSFQGACNYYLISSSTLIVQIHNEPCTQTSGITCITAVTIRGTANNGNFFFPTILYENNAYTYGGNTPNNFPIESEGVILDRTGANKYSTQFADGAIVEVDNNRVIVQLPYNYFNLVGGLCGNWSAINNNTFTLSDGSFVSAEPSNDEIISFGQSWKVPDDELLFSSNKPYIQCSDTVPSTPISFPSTAVPDPIPERCLILNDTRFDKCLVGNEFFYLVCYADGVNLKGDVTLNVGGSMMLETIITYNELCSNPIPCEDYCYPFDYFYCNSYNECVGPTSSPDVVLPVVLSLLFLGLVVGCLLAYYRKKFLSKKKKKISEAEIQMAQPFEAISDPKQIIVTTSLNSTLTQSLTSVSNFFSSISKKVSSLTSHSGHSSEQL